MAIMRRASGSTAGEPFVAEQSGYTRRLPPTTREARLEQRLTMLEARLERLERSDRVTLVTGWGTGTYRSNPFDVPVGAMAYDTGTGRLWMKVDDGWRVVASM